MTTHHRSAATIQSRSGRVALAAGAIALASLASGCNNAGQGALSGAGIGALGGLAIGSMFGASGTGAAVGALGGAMIGGVIGDQNERAERRPQHNW